MDRQDDDSRYFDIYYPFSIYEYQVLWIFEETGIKFLGDALKKMNCLNCSMTMLEKL